MGSGNTWPTYRKVRDAWLAGKSCKECGVGGDALIEAVWREVRLHPFATSRIWSMVDEKRQRYLADCVSLCRSCSARRSSRLGHHNRNEHGGGAQGVRGCGCIPCRDRRRTYSRESKRRAREGKQR